MSGNAPSSRKQEVATSTRGIEDRQPEKSIGGSHRVSNHYLFDDWF
jgi:hypothetical protein